MNPNDLISREALLAEFRGPNKPSLYDGPDVVRWAYKCIDAAPAVDAVSVAHGRWTDKYKSGYRPTHGVVCGECDCWNERRSAYCPNCGAKMDEEENPDE